MNDHICFLITLLHHNSLMRVALKLPRELLQGDAIEYPMEPENLEQLKNWLPLHVKDCGPIVEVTQIFEVTQVLKIANQESQNTPNV